MCCASLPTYMIELCVLTVMRSWAAPSLKSHQDYSSAWEDPLGPSFLHTMCKLLQCGLFYSDACLVHAGDAMHVSRRLKVADQRAAQAGAAVMGGQDDDNRSVRNHPAKTPAGESRVTSWSQRKCRT